MRRVLGLALAAALVLIGAAAPAPAHSQRGTSTFFGVRPDPRECPSPMCGGFFAHRVNRTLTPCADGRLQQECYVAEVDLSPAKLSAGGSARANAALGAGALVRGRILTGTVDGFPGLGKLEATEVWPLAAGTPRDARFHRVEDTGLRCITSPCFSLHASLLNGTGHAGISDLELGSSGAPAAVARKARAALSTESILAAGTIRVVPDAGPAGDGRAYVARAIYLRVR